MFHAQHYHDLYQAFAMRKGHLAFNFLMGFKFLAFWVWTKNESFLSFAHTYRVDLDIGKQKKNTNREFWQKGKIKVCMGRVCDMHWPQKKRQSSSARRESEIVDRSFLSLAFGLDYSLILPVKSVTSFLNSSHSSTVLFGTVFENHQKCVMFWFFG